VATGIASGGNAASKLGVDYSIQVCCL